MNFCAEKRRGKLRRRNRLTWRLSIGILGIIVAIIVTIIIAISIDN